MSEASVSIPDLEPRTSNLESSRAGPTDRVYFPELDGLRFIAFFLVYLFHQGVPGFSGWVNLPWVMLREASPWLGRHAPWDLGRVIQNNGWVGVQLFFILSGYLIATLLLREESRYGRISLRAFWARRILRIWPLYYLTVALTFGLIPWLSGVVEYGPGYGRHLPWSLAFLGNWSMALLGPAGSDAISVLWSVCVEEQFYLAVPFLFVLVGARWRPIVVVGLMGVGIATRAWLAKANAGPLLFQYNSLTHLDTLLSGILLAIIFHRWPPGERMARALRRGQPLLWLAVLWLMTRPELAHGSVSSRTWGFVAIWACGVGVVALARAGRGRFARSLANPRLVWLGKISYGLYMFHEIALWLGRWINDAIGWFPNKAPLMTFLTLALTIGLAAASYSWFELPFLRLKRSWTRVPSRPV